MFIRKRCPKVHVSKPTTNGRRFMEEDRTAMAFLRDYRAGKYPVVGGKR